MPADARVTKMWSQQKGLIPLLFLAFAAYFLFDGWIGYPRNDERWDTYHRLKDQPGEWEKVCAQRHWTTTPPEQRMGPEKYRQQFWWGGTTALIGTVALIHWIRVRRGHIASDEETVRTPQGKRVPYAQITRVDKRLWKSKGFAYIYYSDAGTQRRFTLDDAKYDPKALDTILGDIQTKTSGTAKLEE